MVPSVDTAEGLANLLEVNDAAEVAVTTRWVIPAAMVSGGGALAYYGGAAAIGLVASGTVAGLTGAAMIAIAPIAGAAFVGEGIYFAVTGNFYVP